MADFSSSVSTKLNVPSKYQPYVPYALPIVAAMIGLAVVLLLLLPKINDISTRQTEAEASEARAKALTAKVTLLQRQDQATLTVDLAKTDAAIPSDKDVAGFLSNISQIITSAGASLDGAQLVTSSGSKAAERNSLDFQVIMKGNFTSVKGFLTKIETARRVMVVKSISLLSSETTLTASVSITGYYEPEATITGSDQPLPERGPTQEKLLADLDKRTIYVPPQVIPSISGRTDPFAGF